MTQFGSEKREEELMGSLMAGWDANIKDPKDGNATDNLLAHIYFFLLFLELVIESMCIYIFCSHVSEEQITDQRGDCCILENSEET